MTNAETSPQDTESAILLREGIAAAESGDRERARELLTRVVKLDDRNSNAWLWLSGVVDDLNHRELCLQTALKLDPQNESIQRGLARVRKQKLDELLQAGITAAQRGQRDHARGLLLRVVETDEQNLTAWLWLADLVTTLEDRETALGNALSLDPGNEAARRKLAQVREQIDLERETRAEMAPHFEQVPKPEPGSLTADIDWEHPSPADEFDDELRCPYCAAPTAFEDDRCSACGSSLVTKTRVREERSSYLWIAITLLLGQGSSSLLGLYLALAVLAAELYGQELIASRNVGAALQFLLQPSPEGVPLLGTNLLQLRLLLIAVTVMLLTSGTVLIGLLMRWRLFWYLFLGNTGLGLLVAVAISFLSGEIICGGIMVLIALGTVFLAFQMQDDFSFRYSRILLRPDRSARSASDYLAHARQYARQRMWALAVVHYQRAAGLMLGQLEPHLGLAYASIQLQRYDRAAVALAEARRIAPDDPRVAEMEEMLESVTGDQ